MSGTPPLRPPTGPIALSALLIAAAAWVTVIFQVALAWPLDLGFTQSNAFFVVISWTTYATLLLVLGQATVRSVWLSTLALVVTAAHGTAMLVMLVIQAIGGARSEFIAQTGVNFAVLLVATIGAVLGLLAATRSRRSLSSATGLMVSSAVVGGLAVLAYLGVQSLHILAGLEGHLDASVVRQWAASLAIVSAAVLGGLRHPAPRIIAAVLAVLAAIDSLLTFVGFDVFASGGIGAVALVSGVLRALALLAAAACILGSLPGLARWRGPRASTVALAQ